MKVEYLVKATDFVGGTQAEHERAHALGLEELKRLGYEQSFGTITFGNTKFVDLEQGDERVMFPESPVAA
mgnify:CR=1 FL=1